MQRHFHLFVLAPAHFHAALLQKFMYPQIDSTVKVFAPQGQGIKNYLDFISEYNDRSDNPTHWNEDVYTGPDYLEKMLQQKGGNKTIVVIAGNNEKKTDYISKSIDAGMNVLADKPMVITPQGFQELKAAFDSAKKKEVLLYDIMTMRYDVTSILQKLFMHFPDVFGNLKEGTLADPAVDLESVHHFYKEVSGKSVIRPVWYFDVKQQGEGIVDVTTHLIDLVQWECFPETVFDYKKDVQMLAARHWPTKLTLAQFTKVTRVDSFPPFLEKEIKDNQLYVFANGEMNYTLKGIHIRISAIWKYMEPKGSGDTYYSSIRGTKATLTIRQDSVQHYKPVLYIEPVRKNDSAWNVALKKVLETIQQTYPGLKITKTNLGLEVIIPKKYKEGPEQQFSNVVKKYLYYLDQGKMPQWEVSFMLTKYYTTTEALTMADSQ